MSNTKLKVVKTIKLYVGGEFIRGESGNYSSLRFLNSQEHFAHVTIASRKDLRNAVESSIKAQSSWKKKTGYNRGQILYRMAEMLESKKDEFSKIDKEVYGRKANDSEADIQEAINSLVYYAGFSDKYTSFVDNINPINGPFHNFTTSDPIGVVVLFPDEKGGFAKLIANLASLIVSGNSCLVLLPQNLWAFTSELGEVLATSDVPGGVVNILTTKSGDLVDWVGSHMEIKGICIQDKNSELIQKIKLLAVDNMKRILLPRTEKCDLICIQDGLEFKTSWHPVGF